MFSPVSEVLSTVMLLAFFCGLISAAIDWIVFNAFFKFRQRKAALELAPAIGLSPLNDADHPM